MGGTSSMGSISNKTSLLNDDMEMEVLISDGQLLISIQIDPSKMEDGNSSTLNKYKLLLTTQKLFTAIVSSVDIVPEYVIPIYGGVF